MNDEDDQSKQDPEGEPLEEKTVGVLYWKKKKN